MRNLYLVITVFVLTVITVLIAYFKGRKDTKPPTVKYPEGKNGIPKGWTPLPLIESLHKTMDGLTVNKLARDQAWLDLSKLATGDMVVAVYDGYNQLYFKDGGTLTQWINDESVLGWPSLAKDAALNRLKSLNLN